MPSEFVVANGSSEMPDKRSSLDVAVGDQENVGWNLLAVTGSEASL
jgi:hypothetical protein